ncbi:cell division protein FtsA [Candidatus Persebacteraceae bacterium Df01]|jgi:cell division protein FtsA|uniref:Cell division protein FtsA n=1 Tax=Candidatus Doriopsillibacter californiensis TaxID=2970740 RepID=A0ABT7QKM2_9GAMM|nr:cell division protein FtsA [Candidatus Persebacteraceae bacterium Df01]
MKNGDNKTTTQKRSGPALAAADFGSAAVRVLVAEAPDEHSIRLLGIGEAPTGGIREGRVVNIEQATAAFGNALKEAEIMSKCKVQSVWPAVAGEHISGVNTTGSTVISEMSVSVSDISKVKAMARAEVAPRTNMRVIATLERDYEVDGQKGVQKPLGMSGHKLSGDMHLVLASANVLADLEKCMLQCGVEVENQFVFSGLGAACSVLTDDEKRLGVCVADIGAGTTDVAVYSGGVVCKTFSIPIASDDIHNDIAHMHHASMESAERAKKQIGLTGDGGEFVSLSEVGGDGESRQSMHVMRDTISHRVDEILETVANRLAPYGSESRPLSAGVVLVGDGALMPGITEAAAAKLNMPARVGHARYRGENHERVTAPRFATSMGLLSMAATHRYESAHRRRQEGFLADFSSWWRKLLTDKS